jgi:hippurate hydrolase
MVTRQFDVFDPVVLTVGSFHAGTADNVIPDDAELHATVRSFSPAARTAIQQAAPKLARDIATAHGLTVTTDYEDGYPVTVNNDDEVAFAEQTVAEVLGRGRFVTAPNPIPGSEDFSYVLNEVPGAYLMLGAVPASADPLSAPFNHSPRAVFDDAALPDGAALYAGLALRRLARATAHDG